MTHDAWRGLVGTVKPTKTAVRSLEELYKLLPEGVGLLPLFLNIRHGTLGEFRDVLEHYEERIAELAEDGSDIIHPAGTPPFMLLGYAGEQKLIAEWEKKYGVPIFTSGSNQVRGLKALKIRKVVGIGYDFDDTSVVARYLIDAGFDVRGLAKLPGPWENVGLLSSTEVYRAIKRIFLEHRDADGIYVQGGKLRMLDMVETLEQDLQVPVLHPAVSTVWEIMQRLNVRHPQSGFGRMMRELPDG